MEVLYEPVAVRHTAALYLLAYIIGTDFLIYLNATIWGMPLGKPEKAVGKSAESKYLSMEILPIVIASADPGGKYKKRRKNMTKKSNQRFLSLILSMMLIVAMALSMTACSDNAGITNNGTEAESQKNTQTDDAQSGPVVLGEGNTVFAFTVTDADGNEKAYEIHTDKTVVGEALQELNLIAGAESEFGLYVKTVDGITLDYDKDGKYWAFYINGEYAMTGVDTTPIAEGESYAFKVE